jgi:hypothetical protein
MRLAEMNVRQVRAALRTFDLRYKRDWQGWMKTYSESSLTSPETVATCRAVLVKWQAVRSKTKGRRVRLVKTAAQPGTGCLDDLLIAAAAPLKALERTTVRDIADLSRPRRDALVELWGVFRELPTIGHARAVGITKAVKLVTGGRIGPALDGEVRRKLQIREPETAEQWVDVLQFVSDDIRAFEESNDCRLEDLVEVQWQPVAVGRVYDMVFGPRQSQG